MVDKEVIKRSVNTSLDGFRRKEILNKRPKLLFLARPFPPARYTACVRTWNIAKYLAKLGWDITVVTPFPSVWRHVDNIAEMEANLTHEGIRYILTGHHWRCLLPDHLNCWNKGLGWFSGGICRQIARRLGIDNGVGWINPAMRACSALTSQDVDVILATGKPFAAFMLAKRLSDRLGRPYVLDYRDPWTGNPHEALSSRAATFQKEARLLAASAAATVVSRSWGLAADHRFGLGSKLHVITNGYDLEELADIKPYEFGHFAIVYTGRFYPPKRVISPVMEALRRLKEIKHSQGSEWYFHYYGNQGNHVHQEAMRFGVAERVVLHGSVSRAEALSAVRGAKIAVVITSVANEVTMEDRGIVPGKVFEALGLKTPILLLAPSDSDAEAIAETTGLARSFTANDIEGMTSFLSDIIHGWSPEPKDCTAYDWTNIVKKMDSILRRVIGSVSQNE